MHLDLMTQKIPRHSEGMADKSAVWTLSQPAIKESDVWDKWSNLGSLLQVTILFEKQLPPCCLVLIEMQHVIRWHQLTRMLSDPPSPLTAIHSYSISTKAWVWHMWGVRDKPQINAGMNHLNEHVEKVLLKGRPAVASYRLEQVQKSHIGRVTTSIWLFGTNTCFIESLPQLTLRSLLVNSLWPFNRGGKIIGLFSKWWH